MYQSTSINILSLQVEGKALPSFPSLYSSPLVIWMPSVLPLCSETTLDVVIFAFNHQASFFKLKKNGLQYLLISFLLQFLLHFWRSRFLSIIVSFLSENTSFIPLEQVCWWKILLVYLPLNMSVSLSLLKSVFHRYRVLGWLLSSFKMWEVSCFLLIFVVIRNPLESSIRRLCSREEMRPVTVGRDG